MSKKPKPATDRKPTRKERRELAALYQEYTPVRRQMTEDEKRRAYAEIRELF